MSDETEEAESDLREGDDLCADGGDLKGQDAERRITLPYLDERLEDLSTSYNRKFGGMSMMRQKRTRTCTWARMAPKWEVTQVHGLPGCSDSDKLDTDTVRVEA